MTSKKQKLTFKRNKKLKVIYHPDSGLVIESAKKKVVVSRIVDGELQDLDSDAVALCKKYGLSFDPKKVVDESSEEEESSDESGDESGDENESKSVKKSDSKKSSKKKDSDDESGNESEESNQPKKSTKQEHSDSDDDEEDDDSSDDEEEESRNKTKEPSKKSTSSRRSEASKETRESTDSVKTETLEEILSRHQVELLQFFSSHTQTTPTTNDENSEKLKQELENLTVKYKSLKKKHNRLLKAMQDD